MKKLIAVAALFCATAIMVQAAPATNSTNAAATTNAAPVKKELTPEQKALKKEMLAKYDTNKDGKLDKTEIAAMSQEDKDKWIKAGFMKAHKAHKADAPAAPAAGN
jgi:hypothetical protein